ncbi:MAG: acetylornithine/N-succinyldiaminopimelate aminotransferase [Acidobacteriota bacterium]|jgi:acetylornithine/succinyldiaminopimelate/putrescine aminotransferase|nr:acetylornithine/N-succinyldiaminopimelate aminotransferase [Acidobacteriota bacterium]
MKAETTSTFEEITASEDRFQLATYKKMPLVAERGQGVWLYASDGKRYLDLYGGHAVAGTGHCHPRVVAAIQAQAETLLFYSNLVYSDVRARAAELLVSLAPQPIRKAFFCNSGTEANENAMRMARMATRREKIITFTGSFHGRTADAISATALGKYRELGRPNVPGHLFAEFGDIEAVEKLADETVAAIMLEPVQSMAGVRMADAGFYQALRELCDARGMLLIYDEVQTGVGRTGEWFFAGSEAGSRVVPDIITLAKALGSGVPVGACLVNEQVAAHVKENDLGTTFGGGMLAMAAVGATIEAIEADGMLENVKTIESYLRERLAEIPQITGVRGLGFLLGLEFTEKAAPIHQALLERRIITGTSSDANVLRLLPPLCLGREEVDLFVNTLKAVMSDE